MVKARPDLFYAYVGIGQLGNLQRIRLRHLESHGAGERRGMSRRSQRLRRSGRRLGLIRETLVVFAPSHQALRETTNSRFRGLGEPTHTKIKKEKMYKLREWEAFSYLQIVGLKGNGMFSKVIYKTGEHFEFLFSCSRVQRI